MTPPQPGSSAALDSVSASDAVTAEAAMRRALQLAERGWGRVHPNPLVGAVVVREGEVVGEGWHAEFGDAHAEVVALRQAGDAARGATLHVTLEPCTHHGKQPPCVDAIVAAGIAHVAMAMPDPNPAAAGGAAYLERRGITVESGRCGAEAARLNFRFLQRFRASGLPFVTVKLAVSMDGKVADRDGASRWISGPEAREWVHRLRAGYAGIAVGAATAVADRVRLTVRGAVTPRVPPARIVVARDGAALPADLLARGGDEPAIVLRVGATAGQSSRHRDGWLELGAPDLRSALAALAARDIDALLVEGGGRLAGALLAAGLVDRVHQVQAPVWLGDGVPAWAGLGALPLAGATHWHTVDRVALGDDTLLTLER